MHQVIFPMKTLAVKEERSKKLKSLKTVAPNVGCTRGVSGPFQEEMHKVQALSPKDPLTPSCMGPGKQWFWLPVRCEKLMTGIQRFCPSHDISFLTHSDPLGHSPIVNTSPSRKLEFSWVFNMHKETRSSNSIPFLWHEIVRNTPRGTTPLRLPNLFSGFILNKDNDMQTCHVMNTLCKARNAKQEPPQNIS